MQQLLYRRILSFSSVKKDYSFVVLTSEGLLHKFSLLTQTAFWL